MRLYGLNLTVFVAAADQPDALRRGQALQAAVKAQGLEAGQITVREVPDGEVDQLPAAARRLLERETRARFGPGCSVHERTELLRAVTAASGGQLDVAERVLRGVERGLGYIPSSIAEAMTVDMLEIATRPGEAA